MATTVLSAFATFKHRLEITELQVSTVSTRQAAVREAMASHLNVLDDFLTGSYSRNTMIAPLGQADIDIFVVIDPEYYSRDGQVALLDRTRRVLRTRYPKTPDISRNGQAVTIKFNDFAVDVVPAFYRTGGGHLIPNSRGRTWIETDPKRHVVISSQANANHNGDLVPLVKMIKSWNRTIGRPFSSFHLETLAWTILDQVVISDFPSGLRYYFDKGRQRIAEANPDPAGFGGDVGYYIDSQKINAAVSAFNSAFSRAAGAEASGRQGNTSKALDGWRSVLGESFPTYG